MKKLKIIATVFGIIAITSTIVMIVIALKNGVGLYSENTFPFSRISSISLLVAMILFIVVNFKERNTNEIDKVIKSIDKQNKKNFNSYHYFYAIMYEIQFGGQALIDVDQDEFLNKNWKLMTNRFKRIIKYVHKLYMENNKDFQTIFIYLHEQINNDHYMKWVKNPAFRLLQIKSLHDSEIDQINFDATLQELVILVNAKFSIDVIPLTDPIELRFKTTSFKDKIKEIENINNAIQDNGGIIFSIDQRFENESFIVNVDYSIFTNKDYDKFIDLEFECEDIKIFEYQ